MKVVSVNISEKTGTIKHPVGSIIINEKGVVNDAHAGNWHRQVSMLGTESISKFSADAKREINYGEFAENITTEGMELFKANVLDRFHIGDVILELTQIGKECHGSSCSIFKEVGNCVMPKEGIFCRVIQGGEIKAGDEIIYNPKVYNIAILTLSDRASAGEYSDRSGPRIEELITDFFNKQNTPFKLEYTLLPDNRNLLLKKIHQLQYMKFDIVFTTGGTGIGSRDFTVDAIKPMLDKEIPGIMDFIRFKYGSEKPNALISRAVAGMIGKTMIFTLPGSVKAVNEYMAEITKVLNHLFLMIHDIDAH